MIDKYKRLIMEVVPNVPGAKTSYGALLVGVDLYLNELGYSIKKKDFMLALEQLSKEQCLVYFNKSDIRPTQYGLLKYE